ncbi:MAG: hypothetical protein K2X99_04315 [Gemmatimonadaceae bacterium]|nr:hypothetical protein [Gemmatimonadaceae bacterium]
MLVLSRQYGSLTHRRFENDVASLPNLTRRELASAITRLTEELREARATLRPRISGSDFIKFFLDARKNTADYVFLSKVQLFGFWREPTKLFPYLLTFPWHTRISVDIHGFDMNGNPGEWRLLEAAVYEDMCAHFNRAWRLLPVVTQASSARLVHKESAASRRAAVSSAFYLVEEYLNSIAFDHVVVAGKTLPKESLDLLTEWDSSKGRRRLVSFRKKLLHYPRIILNRPHPVFQENNFTEIAFLLNEAKDFRDSIVHASPLPSAGEMHLEKDARFWQAGLAHSDVYRRSGEAAVFTADEMIWTKIVDTSLEVILLLEHAISGNADRLFWLQKRVSSGPFDDGVFE